MEQTLFTNQTLYDRRIYMATQRVYYYKKQWKSRLFALIWGALCFYIAYLKCGISCKTIIVPFTFRNFKSFDRGSGFYSTNRNCRTV